MPTLSSMAILFLLCMSLHSCNGRNLLVEINDVGHKKQMQDLNKANDQNAISTSSPKIVDISLLNKLDNAESDNTVQQIRVNGSNQKRRNSEAITEKMKQQKRLRSKDSVLNGHGSLDSVSFRVPRNNEGLDHHPEFNLDYSPPKTHPPVHN